MDDFASSAMMRLIGLGLELQSIPNRIQDVDRGAKVDLSMKRSFIQSILEEHGEIAILKIGEAVKTAPDDPILTALTMARSPEDLIQRWQRLEKFTHSRHRTRILESSEGRTVLEHFALDSPEPPRKAEDLVVFGLLVALVEAIGTPDVTAVFPQDHLLTYDKNNWRQRKGKCSSTINQLQVKWNKVPKEKFRTDFSNNNETVEARVLSLLDQDPGRHWTLSILSEEVGMSSRSLQRHLKNEGSSFGALLEKTRLNWASKNLVDLTHSVSEIGYGAGFSDQAHFTRVFKKAVGTTPSRYRRDFRVAL